MVESGFLLYADVRGFSAPLSASEREHAIRKLASLLSAVTQQLSPGLNVRPAYENRILATSPDGNLPRGAVLLDLIEQAFASFRATQIQMMNDGCTCPACRAAADATLAFVVLRGMWTRHATTNDVIMCSDDSQAARTLAESEASASGGRAFLTSIALSRMGVNPELAGMRLYRAAEDFGGGDAVWSVDLEPLWGRAEASTVRVGAADVVETMEVWLPVPEPDAWDWLTAPDKRTLWEDVDTIESFQRLDGRLGVGTRYHSVQLGYVDEVREVLDWKPFRYWTWDVSARGVRVRTTFELTPVDGGTRVVSAMGLPRGSGSVQRLKARREIKRRLSPRREAALRRLRALLDVERGVADAHPDRSEATAAFRAGAGSRA